MDLATISIACTVICCIVSASAFVRSGKKDSTETAEAQGRMLEKMDQVHREVQKLNDQYVEIAKFNSQSDERFKTLFSDMHSMKEKVERLERK